MCLGVNGATWKVMKIIRRKSNQSHITLVLGGLLNVSGMIGTKFKHMSALSEYRVYNIKRTYKAQKLVC